VVEAEAWAGWDGGNVALEAAAASAHTEDMGHTVNVGAGADAEAAHCSIAEAAVAGGMDSADMDSHRDWDTSAELEDSLGYGFDDDYGSGYDCDCTASSCPYLAAYQTLELGLALPADDGRSSCRRGRTVGVEAPRRPRSESGSCALLRSF